MEINKRLRDMQRTLITAWMYCPEQMFVSSHPDCTRFTQWDVMVAQGVVFLTKEERAQLASFDWLGQRDAQMDWHDGVFLEQVLTRLQVCARDNVATTPSLYKL